VTACSGPWRLTLLGNCQCGVGLRRRTALAASASWDDLACSGPRRATQLGWAIRCDTSSENGASDFFSLPAQRWRSCAQVKQVGEVDLQWWLRIDGDLGMWGNIAHYPGGDKGNGTVAWSTVAGVTRPPRVVILQGDESEVQQRKWRGPRALCYRGGDCEAAYKRSGFGGISLSGGGLCCSSTAIKGPAWRCLPGAVCLYLSVPCRCRITSGGSRQLHECGCFGGATGSGFAAFITWSNFRPGRVV
jgi:hypothetical protein